MHPFSRVLSAIRSFGHTTLAAAHQRPQVLLVVFIAYFLTAQIGYYLYLEANAPSSVIWISIGIAFAAVILAGYTVWPAITAGALLHGITIDLPALIIVGSVIGNTLQPLLGYYLLRRIGFNIQLSRVWDMFGMVAVGLVVTMVMLTISVGAAALYNHLYDADRTLSWTMRWVGSALSTLALTPLFVRWLPYPLPRRSPAQYVEIALVTAALCTISFFLFSTPHSNLGGISLAYFLVAVLFWAAFRLGPRFMALHLFLMTAISLAGTVYGTYSSSEGDVSERLWTVQVFDLIIIVFFFVLVSIEEQRKEAEKAMMERTKELEKAITQVNEAAAAKNAFIATLAHELRNPLAGILASTELTERERHAAERAIALGHIRSHVRTMTRLLEDLLDVSRLSRGKLVLKKERCDFRSIATRTVENVRPFMEGRGHTFSFSLPSTPVILLADAVRIEQVLMNLLSNAVKYTPENGTISLEARTSGTQLVIRISDSGIGIAPDLHDRIFEPFVQIPTSESASGVGIGLALTKQLVALHRGSINVESAGDGAGSIFTVQLPLASPGGPRPQSELQTTTETSQGTRSLILVDDNTSITSGLQKLLRYENHDVLTAATGSEALHLIATTPRDAAIIDIGLPDMTGHELATELRMHYPHMRLIALSGYGQESDKEQALKAGFDTHLTKPVSLAELLAALDRLPPKEDYERFM